MVRSRLLMVAISLPLLSFPAEARRNLHTLEDTVLSATHKSLKASHFVLGVSKPVLKIARTFAPEEVGLGLQIAHMITKGIDKVVVTADRLVKKRRKKLSRRHKYVPLQEEGDEKVTPRKGHIMFFSDLMKQEEEKERRKWYARRGLTQPPQPDKTDVHLWQGKGHKLGSKKRSHRKEKKVEKDLRTESRKRKREQFENEKRAEFVRQKRMKYYDALHEDPTTPSMMR